MTANAAEQLSSRTRALMAVGVIFSGLLAGSNLDRALVAMPAWRQLTPAAWAAFSRHADLGGGLVLYPIEALVGAAFVIGAAISASSEPGSSSRLTGPLYGAAIAATAGLLLTLKAAPAMLNLTGAQSPASLLKDFEQFRYWGNLRALCQVTVFLAELWALAAVNGVVARTGASKDFE